MLISCSILFTNLSHPLSMGLILLIQTVLISLTLGLSSYSFWFSYILFLVFLGGMLVLFIYVSSLAPNENFFSLDLFIVVFVSTLIFTSATLMLDPILSNFNHMALPLSTLNYFNSTPLAINWIYNSPSMIFTIFIVSYLLLALIIIVKIINLFKGPLRLLTYGNTYS
uniref:NADH-ubiquinone oxidoreductase chain 6 n=1 Tax=Macrophthalmus abbreviatus TaxID=220121 RepID=A0A891GZG8_9EUCA|nr:NADH dehydrogenase subunit 6 [Macrophthalmus abbreviatus]QRK27330.1 NADH dehydrogenase subunit 6 [Macrophthalmus abbreviatus]